MKRVLLPVLALLVVAGCATTPPVDNPFLGPATVPPPGTGQAGAMQPAPYYPPVPQQGYPLVPQQGSVPLGSGSRYGAVTAAPGPSNLAVERIKVTAADRREIRAGSSLVARGNVPNRTVGSRSLSDAATLSTANHVAGAMARADGSRSAGEGGIRAASGETRNPEAGGKERFDGADDGSIVAASPGSVIRIVEPEPRIEAEPLPATSNDDPQEPRRFQPPTDLIDITELPEASGDSSGRARRTSSTSGQSTSSVGSPAQGGTARNVGTSADYAHDPDYAWLKGKLERSRVNGRWKLRYIPIDGETDRFGGSVVLVDSPLLDGYQPGQFVAVEGDLGNNQPADYGFAPPYSIHRVAAVER